MSGFPQSLAQQISAIEAALQLPLPEESRRQLLDTLQSLKAAVGLTIGGAVAGDKIDLQGTVDVSGTAHVAVGINLGQIVYGVDPTEVQREQIARYLRRLAAKLQRLPLRGLAAHLDEGSGILLAKVYVMLATTSLVVMTEDSSVLTEYIHPVAHFYEDEDRDKPLKADYDPDHALPDQAIVVVEPHVYQDLHEPEVQGKRLYRALLATEAAQQHRCLVLLGDPGSGKSTFLRHLAWMLAQRSLNEQSDETGLFGWDATVRLLPILLSLRKLAGLIATAGTEPATISAALREELMREYDVQQASDLLDRALTNGAVLLLFDGLDEVPLDAIPGVTADRLTTLWAVRAFTELHDRAQVVLTCRTRAFDPALHDCLSWHVETIAPLTLGQIRHFVADWYQALIERGSIAHDLGKSQQQALIGVISKSNRLRTMANTPLLLTMMALVLSERGELPRDRPLLYERILEQLLGQWDQQKGGQSLTDALDASNLRSDDLRPILDKLSYEAHASASSQDGRGRLVAKDLRYALAEFLEKVRVRGAWEAAGRCLAYFNERSGLLLPEDDGQAYVFAHLTLQEHGAGRHMLLQPNAVELVMQRRTDDRWREPIGLGLGVVQKLYPMLTDRIDRIFTELIDQDERGYPKPRERWYRDLILAAELGQERDWDLLRARINVDRLQRDLRRGLGILLADTAQPLPLTDRIHAGELLADLGDQRFPISVDDWRRELTWRNQDFGKPAGYWCYVRDQTYTIGGWREGAPTADIDLPSFWIARYPITVAQYTPFISVGYSWDAERWWSPEGWRWKGRRTMSYLWNQTSYNGINQPVIGVSWYEAMAFCAWLTEQLGAMLPKGYVVRLPTEAEWEAAAAYDMDMQRRNYPWGKDELTPERAIYTASNLRYPAPIGSCPAGRAACGALDMVGNVWEWSASHLHDYPMSSNRRAEDFKPSERFTVGDGVVPLRGGGWNDNSTSVRCRARIGFIPNLNLYGGFRVVIAPRSH